MSALRLPGSSHRSRQWDVATPVQQWTVPCRALRITALPDHWWYACCTRPHRTIHPFQGSALSRFQPRGSLDRDFRGLGKRQVLQIISGPLGALLHAVKRARLSALKKPNPGLEVAGVTQVAVNRELGTQEGRA